MALYLRSDCLRYLIASLLIVSCFTACKKREQEQVPITLKLTIDFGDGRIKEFENLAGRQGMTVLEAMQVAAREGQGLKFSTVGGKTGANAFVDQIEGLKNEGAGATAKNWTYGLNGERAQLGAGSQTLKDGDVVLWKFDAAPVE